MKLIFSNCCYCYSTIVSALHLFLFFCKFETRGSHYFSFNFGFLWLSLCPPTKPQLHSILSNQRESQFTISSFYIFAINERALSFIEPHFGFFFRHSYSSCQILLYFWRIMSSITFLRVILVSHLLLTFFGIVSNKRIVLVAIQFATSILLS